MIKNYQAEELFEGVGIPAEKHKPRFRKKLSGIAGYEGSDICDTELC